MKRIVFAVAAGLAAAVISANAQAQTAGRTFVSGLGSDTNPCSRTAPCRSFSYAITQTNAGGEVVALDSAGYGSLVITKSIQVIAPPGVDAAVLATNGGDGIDVAGGGTETVVLRGLRISGEGTGKNGINATGFKDLHIENCVISGFTGIGIEGDVSSNNSRADVHVNDTIVRDNGNDGLSFTAPDGQTVYVSVDHTRLEINGGDGITARDSAQVAVSQSVASGNGVDGFAAISTGDGTAELDCDGCVASGNSTDGFATGLSGSGSSTEVMAPPPIARIRVARSTAVRNSVGFDGSSSLSVSNHSKAQTLFAATTPPTHRARSLP